ncbi:hypothetical protein C3F09_11480 [candidate division GN15 bacterium]|uniref:Uncharacterized protein n=1 Tax=candidate division GN15 bacterium TaxID=2072418 RepID=A0A855X3E1_9BACT|nr:MAG: hypothetical protein C3F09_11480 [candidate division GN15 bacterium]
MRTIRTKLSLVGLVALGLVTAGCLVSGTFVISHDFTFTAAEGFYFYPIDVTAEPDWAKHRDDINDIDAVGFEMTMNNENPGPVTFSAYIAPYDTLPQYETKDELDSNAYIVIADLEVPSGTSTMTYAQSLGHIQNLAKFKELAITGKFSYYGVAEGITPGSFTVDPGKVILTVSASD